MADDWERRLRETVADIEPLAWTARVYLRAVDPRPIRDALVELDALRAENALLREVVADRLDDATGPEPEWFAHLQQWLKTRQEYAATFGQEGKRQQHLDGLAHDLGRMMAAARQTEHLEALARELRGLGWVDAREHEPEEGQLILGGRYASDGSWIEERGTYAREYERYRREGTWQPAVEYANGEYFNIITHWRPLPPPPTNAKTPPQP